MQLSVMSWKTLFTCSLMYYKLGVNIDFATETYNWIQLYLIGKWIYIFCDGELLLGMDSNLLLGEMSLEILQR